MVRIVLAAVAYDHSIESRFGDEIKITVAGDNQRAAEIEQALRAFSKKKLAGRPISVTRADVEKAKETTPNILFFAESLHADNEKWVSWCQTNQVTCVSADQKGVEAGIALAVEMTAAGRPKLLINLESAQAAGSKFSGQVLRLARIIEGSKRSLYFHYSVPTMHAYLNAILSADA